jgi:hypothetical protein
MENWKLVERRLKTKWKLPSWKQKGDTWRQRERRLLTPGHKVLYP